MTITSAIYAYLKIFKISLIIITLAIESGFGPILFSRCSPENVKKP